MIKKEDFEITKFLETSHRMGQRHTKQAADSDDSTGESIVMKTIVNDSGELMQKYQYERAPLSTLHHFIPATLPMMPMYNAAFVAECNKSWKIVLTAGSQRMKSYGKTGIVLFYDEFFLRLFQRDASFQQVFPNIKKRSEILIKAMTLMLKSSTDNNAQLINKIRYLGHRHRSFPKIRSHQFATYASTAVEVIMFWMDEYATPDSAEAWSNVVGFFLKHMLESFLPQRVDPFESHQNATLTEMQAIHQHSLHSQSKSSTRSVVPSSNASAWSLSTGMTPATSLRSRATTGRYAATIPDQASDDSSEYSVGSTLREALSSRNVHEASNSTSVA